MQYQRTSHAVYELTVPSRVGPEVPEGRVTRVGRPVVQADLPGDGGALRVCGGGARGAAGSCAPVRLRATPLESGGAGERPEERLGTAVVQGVPEAAPGDVERGTLEQRILRPGHR